MPQWGSAHTIVPRSSILLRECVRLNFSNCGNISAQRCYIVAAPKGDHACTRVIARVFTLGPAATAVTWHRRYQPSREGVGSDREATPPYVSICSMRNVWRCVWTNQRNTPNHIDTFVSFAISQSRLKTIPLFVHWHLRQSTQPRRCARPSGCVWLSTIARRKNWRKLQI